MPSASSAIKLLPLATIFLMKACYTFAYDQGDLQVDADSSTSSTVDPMLLAGTSTVPALRLPSTPSYSLPLGADLMIDSNPATASQEVSMAGTSTVPTGAISTPAKVLPYSVYTPKPIATPSFVPPIIPVSSGSATPSSSAGGMTISASSTPAGGSQSSMITQSTRSAASQMPSSSASASASSGAAAGRMKLLREEKYIFFWIVIAASIHFFLAIFR